MSKSKDANGKSDKKTAVKTLKEKRAAKADKKKGKNSASVDL